MAAILSPPISIALTVTVGDGESLQAAIDEASNNDTLILAPAIFDAVPTAYVDSLCGNCLEHKTIIAASYGFIIKDN